MDCNYKICEMCTVALKKSFRFHRLKWNGVSVPFRSVPLYNRQGASPAKLRAKCHPLVSSMRERLCSIRFPLAFRCQCTVNSKNPATRANCHALFLSNGTERNGREHCNGTQRLFRFNDIETERIETETFF